MELICSRCNEKFEHHRKRKTCFKCIPEKNSYSSVEERDAARKKKMVANVQRRRNKIKEMSVEYKGSKCEICGYDKCNEALEFHHINPEEKDFGIGEKGYTRSWDSVKKELDKCIMVCANYHREIHANIITLDA